MTLVVGAMVGAGVAGLIAGLVLVRARFATASGASRILVLGPVFVATALAIFAAEHFFAARDLMQIVPRWLPCLCSGLISSGRRCWPRQYIQRACKSAWVAGGTHVPSVL